MTGRADNPNGELKSYITGADNPDSENGTGTVQNSGKPWISAKDADG